MTTKLHKRYTQPRKKGGIIFDKSINIGNLITVGIILFSLIQMYAGITTKMTEMQDKVDMMWAQFTITFRNPTPK